MIITNALYTEIDRLKAENKKLTIKTSNSLANNLCPDHRDKQAGKPCLACEIDRLRARVKELEDCIDGQWGPALIRGMKDEINKLKDERDGYRNGQQQVQDLLAKQIDNSLKLAAENRRLRELVDGATVAVELFKDTAPAQKKWREEWLKKAAKALKEASHE